MHPPLLQNKSNMNIPVHVFWSTYACMAAEHLSRTRLELLAHV